MLIVHSAVVLAFAALLIWAGYSDFRSFIVPNRVTLAIVSLYPAHVVSSPVPVDWHSALTTAGVVLVGGFFLFTWRILGGGDAKLIAAVGLWSTPLYVAPAFLIITLSGGIICVAALLKLCLSPTRPGAGASALLWLGAAMKTYKVPYGVAIAAGGLFTASQLLVS